jgi:hypothetical protein
MESSLEIVLIVSIFRDIVQRRKEDRGKSGLERVGPRRGNANYANYHELRGRGGPRITRIFANLGKMVNELRELTRKRGEKVESRFIKWFYKIVL